MKIGIIHATCNAVPALNAAFKQLAPDVTVLNFVDENIQYHANRINGLDDKLFRDFVHMAGKAQEAGVDAILVACTVLTPVVDTVKPFISVPIFAVDRPMLEKAVTHHRKIGVVATTAPSGPATKAQLVKLAGEWGQDIEVETEIVTQAMTALKAGDEEEHNQLNRLAAAELQKRGCEVIILAQITQACAEDETSELGLPVLTSPKEAVNEIIRVLAQDKVNT
ncbi:aspartate/glutamate racemase family protein [Fictibacillus phosphorivorans]|uniref:aspartate/glutamate racemase family protein n=1 Tax=Fictibacillus phosphorivorans TaxID=1221500 RepID=UPI00203B0953|nr:aspartate/glutamate racemase family protein [Fictibacillus phosphorivorans]MCM3718642.1 aspartate/glutamate racemase family protein [Fictibacillus phosphorivorans]MCM3776265.1 aspartate/glutamate racemase family protein [Fictibacillus phosphorivorans]